VSVQNVFQRYEIKYVVTRRERRLLEWVMQDYMRPDRYCRSTVCSVYYDTPDRRVIRRCLEKPAYREKLRLRSYGPAQDEDTVFVELKKKCGQMGCKRRAAMPLADARQYLAGGTPPGEPGQILREIDYFRLLYPDLAPSVVICCRREAYCGVDDPALRVTFDEDILWRDTDLALAPLESGAPLLHGDEVLLEIKAPAAIPLWLTRELSRNRIYRTPFSKYGNAYQAMLQGGLRHA